MTDPSQRKTARQIQAETIAAESGDANTGIVCPFCGCGHLPSGSTRREGKTMVRYRYCRNAKCGRAIRTVESVEGIVTPQKSSENSTPPVNDSLHVYREAV